MIWECGITRAVAKATAACDHIEIESVFGFEFSVYFSVGTAYLERKQWRNRVINHHFLFCNKWVPYGYRSVVSQKITRDGERTFESHPNLFGALLLNEDGGAVECVIALNVLFVHLTGLQFEKGVNVEIFKFWWVKYYVGQVAVATLLTVGDACERREWGPI